jgi:hypothetical protein
MRSFVIAIFSTAFLFAVSQAEPWSKSFDTDLTLTQNSYSDSWTGGEAGNISWVWNANGQFEKQTSPKFKFRNTSKFSFGQTHIQDKETKDWAKPQKSTDLIDIENLGLFTLHKYVDPYIGLRFESQFLDASVPGVNLYFNPRKITESAGVARQFYKKEKDELLSRLGFAFRQIMTEMVIDTLNEETGNRDRNHQRWRNRIRHRPQAHVIRNIEIHLEIIPLQGVVFLGIGRTGGNAAGRLLEGGRYQLGKPPGSGGIEIYYSESVHAAPIRQADR